MQFITNFAGCIVKFGLNFVPIYILVTNLGQPTAAVRLYLVGQLEPHSAKTFASN